MPEGDMATTSRIRTAQDLWDAGDIGPCELVRGVLVMMTPPGGEHADITLALGSLLRAHVVANRLGKVLAEAGFVLSRDPDTVRAPDVAVVRAGRRVTKRYIEGAPDLAVEVRSPDDRPGALAEKVADWLAAGCAAVWVVDPGPRTVTVHERGGSRVLTEGDVLRGDPVVPGFETPVAGIFT